MSNSVIVTGGLGYIGSHTVVELKQAGFKVVVIDNLSNSKMVTLERIERLAGKVHFEHMDLRNYHSVRNVLERNRIDNVIHFAASKDVNQSQLFPMDYYENNVTALLNLLYQLPKSKPVNLIFSSSAAVYGNRQIPLLEENPLPENKSVYAETKRIGERMIMDVCNISQMKAIVLRYFNPIGAHDSLELGEDSPRITTSLVANLVRGETLQIYGNDYPTKDGTAVRDYIHVQDVAKAHVAALQRLIDNKTADKVETFNIGTGNGYTVTEVLKAFAKITSSPLNISYANRRAGDVAISFANVDRANVILNWKAERTLQDGLNSAILWENKKEQLGLNNIA